ncbi:Crp/Fnr family transcriptional regulator [bacterium]|nr:Crp/Fnr family transcriptional regulator [bacterium]MBU1072889.1 Crp/Fnr family transcriptional regulator [bacterium]MBU1675913.1 Crp/Fnr family transcriptional regulator [bacterium]
MASIARKEQLEFMLDSPFGRRMGREICAAMLEYAETIEAKADEVIIEQGASPRGLYMVIEGQVKLLRSGPGYREHIVHLAEAHAMFGEGALFLQGHPVATVALQDSRLLLFPREPFLLTMAAYPELQHYIMRVMAGWISQLVEKIDQLTLCDGAQRLARYLVGLHERSPYADYVTGAHVDLPTRKRDLATMLNMNQPSLSRILRQLQDAELIDVQGRRVVLKDMEALRGMARMPTTDAPRRDFD